MVKLVLTYLVFEVICFSPFFSKHACKKGGEKLKYWENHKSAFVLDWFLHLEFKIETQTYLYQCYCTYTLFMCLSIGLPGGLARSTHSTSSSDIKREEKEDDENSSIAEKSDDEKKDSKVARSRTR